MQWSSKCSSKCDAKCLSRLRSENHDKIAKHDRIRSFIRFFFGKFYDSRRRFFEINSINKKNGKLCCLGDMTRVDT